MTLNFWISAFVGGTAIGFISTHFRPSKARSLPNGSFTIKWQGGIGLTKVTEQGGRFFRIQSPLAEGIYPNAQPGTPVVLKATGQSARQAVVREIEGETWLLEAL